MAIEFVDLPIKNGWIFHIYVCLPEGRVDDGRSCKVRMETHFETGFSYREIINTQTMFHSCVRLYYIPSGKPNELNPPDISLYLIIVGLITMLVDVIPILTRLKWRVNIKRFLVEHSEGVKHRNSKALVYGQELLIVMKHTI